MARSLKNLRKVFMSTLCVLLSCCLILYSSARKPAHAEAIPVGDAVAVLIEAGLAALGVGVAGTVATPVYEQIIKNLKTQALIDAAAVCTVSTIAGRQVYNVTSNFLTLLGNQISTAYNSAMSGAILGNISIPLQNISYNKPVSQLYKDLGYTTLPVASGGNNYSMTIYSYSIIGMLAFPVGSSITSWVGANGSTIRAKFDDINGLQFSYGSHPEFYNEYFLKFNSTSIGYIIAYTGSDTGSYTFYSLFSPAFADVSSASHVINWYVFGSQSGATIPAAPGKDVYGLNVDKWFADGVSILNNPVNDVVGRIGDAVGVTNPDGSKSIPLYPPIGAETDTDKARDTDQSKVLDKDIATEADKTKDAATNTGKDTTPPGDKIVDATNGFPKVVDSVGDAFKGLTDLFASLDEFFKFLAKSFPYLPPQFTVIFIAVAAIVVIVRIFGRGD